jgi:hypothetical protein
MLCKVSSGAGGREEVPRLLTGNGYEEGSEAEYEKHSEEKQRKEDGAVERKWRGLLAGVQACAGNESGNEGELRA